jgi:glycosyltransferase involved in cell wall biosynthesis
MERYLHRKWFYPRKVHRHCKGKVAHVLDHSWADMLDFIPAGMKKIVTVHDLFPLEFECDLNKSQIERFRSRVSRIESADHVVAVSEYTKGRIMENFCIDSDRVTVIPNGVSVVRRRYNGGVVSAKLQELSEKYYLVGLIGSDNKRKNLSILPSVLEQIEGYTNRPVAIIRVGFTLDSPLKEAICHVVGMGRFIELGRLADQEVSEFYDNINLLFLPSLAEGFGLPLLEAMAHKVSVLTSDVTSLTEVGGDTVVYFNPEEAGEAADRILELERGMYTHLIEPAFLRASAFSWRSSLESHLELYQRVM